MINSLQDITPPSSLTFGNGSSLSWKNGKLEFNGVIDESAEAFFKFLKLMIDDYIQQELLKKFSNLDYLEVMSEKKEKDNG